MTDFLHDSGKLILATENYIIYEDKLLMHRRSMAKDTSPGYILGPGGRVDQPEDVVQSAAREIQEETGLKVDPSLIELKVVGIHHYPDAGTVWITFINRIVLIQNPGMFRHSEEGTNEWVNLSDISKLDKVFAASKYYYDHVLTPKPGILYTNIVWRNDVPRVLSSTLVRSS